MAKFIANVTVDTADIETMLLQYRPDKVIDWCQEHSATVSFHWVEGKPRVSVRAAGHYAERDTLAEAVAFLRIKVKEEVISA